MEKYDIDKIINLDYQELVKEIKKLEPDEIINLSNQIGYPVFTRLCMGELKHKVILLQDGAAAIILNDNKQILLQLRSDRNKWGLPGGCQELGESFEDTIIREVKEETNFDVKKDNLKLIGVVSGNNRKNKYPNGDIVINNTVLYLIENYSGKLKWNNESKEMKFFHLDNIPENLNDEELINLYKEYCRDNK